MRTRSACLKHAPMCLSQHKQRGEVRKLSASTIADALSARSLISFVSLFENRRVCAARAFLTLGLVLFRSVAEKASASTIADALSARSLMSFVALFENRRVCATRAFLTLGLVLSRSVASLHSASTAKGNRRARRRRVERGQQGPYGRQKAEEMSRLFVLCYYTFFLLSRCQLCATSDDEAAK